MKSPFDYPDRPYAVPQFKIDVHRGAWEQLSKPGSWWSAAERITIASASRAALECGLCAERKNALSPLSMKGHHHGPRTPLTDKVIDTVHRITTDSARLSARWVEGLLDPDFGYGHYVELVSVIVNVISIDTFHRALQISLEPLPDPQPGVPDRYLPPGADIDVAWVPMIWPANLSDREQDIYFGAPRIGHVIRALSLVPNAVRWLNRLSEAHYLPTPQVGDMAATGHLRLSRPQTELVAARTSLLNDCFY